MIDEIYICNRVRRKLPSREQRRLPLFKAGNAPADRMALLVSIDSGPH